MANNLNKKLERLNAQIDVWIDDEDYNKIWFDTKENHNAKGIITLDGNVKSEVKQCFPDDNSYCTRNKYTEWQRALSYGIDSLPVVKVGGEDLKPPDKYWSHLFYAKLLRAKIKQKGNDCYTRRLDDVAAYLERHLPQQNGDGEWETRLTLMYLLELSAVSQDWESLGFAERAWRVITNAENAPRVKTEVKKAPYKFYELWARFNIGIAYFHKSHYRKAVLEFNQIIWQVERWSGPKSNVNRDFFNRHSGTALLYVPAIFSRAEVQLKLQFAYHALDTLDERFWRDKFVDSTGAKKTPQKEIRAMIIETQAYQQMGRLDKSWICLNKAYKKLLGNEGTECLGHRLEVIKPPTTSPERFIDLLIADHLGWLTLRGEDEQINQEHNLELRYIVKHGKTKDGNPVTAENYGKAVNAAKPYLGKLVEVLKTYFNMVEHHAYNRSGYFQQLAKYLAWLAKAADFKCSDSELTRKQEEKAKEARGRIAEIVKVLYETAKNNGLLSDEDKLDKPQNSCRYCKAKGIDLRRLGIEHYMWFTDDVLEFFKSKNIAEGDGQKQQLKKNKKEFVRRLIKREQRDREDLRIHDLKLRYEYYGKEELLEKLRAGEQSRFDYAQEQCWRERKNQAELLNLPICGNNETPEDSHLTSDDYIKIMQDWDKGYLRQLRLPSIHENQKDSFYFMGLQRWNSASPAKGFSVGGGYLLYHLNKVNSEVDMGIAIDPGFDFVRNLFHMGFSLEDIDIVLISHAHLDHIRDFESIVMLLSELEKKGKREKRVHVILSLGAYKRLEHIVEDPGFRYLLEPYIIDVDREIRDDYFEDKEKMPKFRFKPVNNNRAHENSNYMERFKAVLPSENDPTSGLWAKITPTRAYHDDKTRSDSFGFLVELAEDVKEQNENEKQSNLTFGYTGDTKWVYPDMPDPLKREDKHEGRKIEDIAKQYKECDVLLVHLGSLIKKNDNSEWSFNQYDQCGINAGNKYRCEELVRKENHPYLIGMLRLLSSLYESLSKVKHIGMPLVLVGEFGEELRGTIRSDFIRRLQEIYKNELAFLPVDVGMNVQMGKKDGAQGDSCDNRCACKVWCVKCNHFVNIGNADFELYGTDHALYCVCKTCRKATPVNVLQDGLRQLYEVGLELRNNDNK